MYFTRKARQSSKFVDDSNSFIFTQYLVSELHSSESGRAHQLRNKYIFSNPNLIFSSSKQRAHITIQVIQLWCRKTNHTAKNNKNVAECQHFASADSMPWWRHVQQRHDFILFFSLNSIPLLSSLCSSRHFVSIPHNSRDEKFICWIQKHIYFIVLCTKNNETRTIHTHE